MCPKSANFNSPTLRFVSSFSILQEKTEATERYVQPTKGIELGAYSSSERSGCSGLKGRASVMDGARRPPGRWAVRKEDGSGEARTSSARARGETVHPDLVQRAVPEAGIQGRRRRAGSLASPSRTGCR
jgi:hypothetical protein